MAAHLESAMGRIKFCRLSLWSELVGSLPDHLGYPPGLMLRGLSASTRSLAAPDAAGPLKV